MNLAVFVILPLNRFPNIPMESHSTCVAIKILLMTSKPNREKAIQQPYQRQKH